MARSTKNKAPGRRWVARVNAASNALDLPAGIFALSSPREIALRLKESALRSRRRKAPPFRSALSMLVFFINRAGKNLSPSRRATLEKAKDELRRLFGRAPRASRRRKKATVRA